MRDFVAPYRQLECDTTKAEQAPDLPCSPSSGNADRPSVAEDYSLLIPIYFQNETNAPHQPL